MKRVMLAILGVVVLLLLAAGAALLMFDPAGQVPRVAEAVRQATGRTLRVSGPVRLSPVAWPPGLALSAEGATLSNVPGGSAPEMLTAARVTGRLALWPLLSRTVDVRELRLDGVRLLLETDAQGRGNWLFTPPPPPPSTGPAAPSTPRVRPALLLGRLVIEDGAVDYRDGRAGTAYAAQLPHLLLEQAGDGMGLRATVQAAQRLFDVTGTMGSLAALQDRAAPPAPWPLRLAAITAGARATLDGAVEDPARFAGWHFALDGLVPDLAGLLPGAPPLRDVRLGATVTPAGLSAITARSGAADLSRYRAGLRLVSAALALPAPDQPGTLTVDGALDDAALHLAAGVLPRWDARGAALRALRVTLPGGELTGDLAVQTVPKPAIRGTLTTAAFDADTLLAAWRKGQPSTTTPPAAPAAAPAAPAAAPGGPAARLIPDVPLPRYAGPELDLTLNAARLRLWGADWQALATRALATPDLLRIEPLSATGPGGALAGALAIAMGSGGPPGARLSLHAPGLQLAPVLAMLKQEGSGAGIVDLDLDLAGAGSSLRPLLASLDGSLGLAMVDGELDLRPLGTLLGDALRKSGLPAELTGRAALRCFALKAAAQGGLVTIRPLVIDGPRLQLEGEGTVNLGDEALALHLRPVVRIGGTGVALPVRVEGTLAAPRPQLDALGGTGRVGLTIGGPAPSAEDPCGPALAAARGGRVGQMPASAPAAPAANPADLLRGLFGRGKQGG